MNINKEKYKLLMERAICLASKGWGQVSPNPMVGALLVKNGSIISEGYHAGCGLPHAEVDAITKAGANSLGAELIVNLEPCCHYGKTPPCTDLILEKGIKRVVYGMMDPNPKVKGQGIKILRDSGVDVIGPILENESIAINRIYINWIQKNRPFLICKVATSLDGKIATSIGDSKWITNEKCRKRMHYWRKGVDAVLIGAETLRHDNPFLNARDVKCEKQPIPIIISKDGHIPIDAKIFSRNEKPIIFCRGNSLKINSLNAEIISFDADPKESFWTFIFRTLAEKNITSVLVEGGASIHNQLFAEGLYDYAIATLSTKLIGITGKSWFPAIEENNIAEVPCIKPDQIITIEDNVIIEGRIADSG